MAVQVSQAMSGALVQGDMVQKATPDEIKAALVEVTTPSTSLYSNLVQENVEICSPALLTDGSETVLDRYLALLSPLWCAWRISCIALRPWAVQGLILMARTDEHIAGPSGEPKT